MLAATHWPIAGTQLGALSPEGSQRGGRAGGAGAEDPPGTSTVREAGVRVLLVLPSFFLPGFP